MTDTNGDGGVILTAAAASKLRELLEQNDVVETHALRVFVRGGGCSGVQYGMVLDDDFRSNDEVSEQHGVKIIVDPVSMFYLTGARIDYVRGPGGEGFAIANPNAASTCGCGSSSSPQGCSGEPASQSCGCYD